MAVRRTAGQCWVSLLALFYVQKVVQSYTAEDDFSWAIKSNQLNSEYHQELYDRFMEGCRQEAEVRGGVDDCDKDESHRMYMNSNQPPSVFNYTEAGFLKIKAPEKVIRLVSEFWEANRDEALVEWNSATPYHNTWESAPTIIRTDNSSLVGGGPQLQAAIANAARDAMEAWTGLPQSSTSVYGIRVYHSGSILAPHVDRLPLVSSAIINVAQDVDEDWLLEVYDHNGVAHNVTMEPGDLVLYESHSVIHGRPFPLKGRYYANIFVHFEPLGPPTTSSVPYDYDQENPLPPYLIKDTAWTEEWRTQFPNGWTALESAVQLTGRGDLKALRYLNTMNPNKLRDTDGTPAEWQSIHEAARSGHLEIVKFLVDEGGVDVNEPCAVTDLPTPLAVARHNLAEDHPVIEYLLEKGGVMELPDNEEL